MIPDGDADPLDVLSGGSGTQVFGFATLSWCRWNWTRGEGVNPRRAHPLRLFVNEMVWSGEASS